MEGESVRVDTLHIEKQPKRHNLTGVTCAARVCIDYNSSRLGRSTNQRNESDESASLVLYCTFSAVGTRRGQPAVAPAPNDDEEKKRKWSRSTAYQQQRPLPQIFVGAETRQPRQQRPLPCDHGSIPPILVTASGRSGCFQKGARYRVAKHGRHEAVYGFVEGR